MLDTALVELQPLSESFDAFLDFPKGIYGSDWSDSHNYSECQHLHSCYVLKMEGEVKGRFAIYENTELKFKGQQAICIGSYECVDDESVAKILLQHAKDICRDRGYSIAIGPMNGSTWNSYRFRMNSTIPFFLEPNQSVGYNAQFEKNEFETIATYVSNTDEELDFDTVKLQKFQEHFELKGAKIRNFNLNRLEDEFEKNEFETIATYVSNTDEELNFDKAKLLKFQEHFELKGAKIRNFNLDRLEDEFEKMAKLCNRAFQDNFLFTPIDTKRFIEKYKALSTLLNPELVWMVENEQGELDAFLFAIEDFLDKKNKTLIIKTMAVKPKSSFVGIATFLARKTIQIADGMGYTKIIHALIHKGLKSENASDKFSQEIRNTYKLYAAQL